ncbi:hypothetical protein Dda_6202 [Drechslerella dactyloides]|uniref:F-box domain-containing protein n=1 Tax=Drechslerella dactyloides TaxID=74499 RepID=A0AAD6IZM4_DREDA|nr:hypothetical protein Dda_6202 [Drechslerella dactyloides]
MSRICSFPPELIDLITDSLSEEDILALRQTCKALSLLAHDAYLKAVYQCWSAYLMPSSLTSLVNIVRHRSRVNRYMHHLKIHPTLPRITCRNFGDQVIDGKARVMNHYDFILDEDRDLRHLKLKMMADTQDNQVDIGTYNCLSTHLQMAFASLQTLKTAELVTSQFIMSRVEFNQCYPSARATMAEWPTTRDMLTRLLMQLPKGGLPPNYWSPFIRSADVTNLSSTLQTLIISGAMGIPPQWLSDSADKKLGDNDSLFPALKTLNMGLAHMYDRQNCQVADLATSNHLTTFFKIIAHNLETLEVRFPAYRAGPLSRQASRSPLSPNIPRSASAFPAITTLPHLKSLHIQDARLDIEHVLATLDSCPSLETFKLLHSRLPDTEISCFRLLKHIRAANPPTIKNLRLFFNKGANGVPSLAITGTTPWASTMEPSSLDCMVMTPLCTPCTGIWTTSTIPATHISYRNLASELDQTDCPRAFWMSMSNGKWTRDSHVGVHETLSRYLFWNNRRDISGNVQCAKICGSCSGCYEQPWDHSRITL